MLRKLGRNYQVALPREIVSRLRLQANDYIDITVRNNRIILEPQVVVPKDQAYFYTPEWQKEEAHAGEDIKKGKATKTKNLKQLFNELDR